MKDEKLETCREAQSLIVPFIEDKLDDEHLEAFLNHIENCSECYDELEVYFIVFSGTRQLDNDYDDISDFKGELRKYIERKKEKYHKKHKHALWIRIGVAAAMCCAVFFTVFVAMYRSTGNSFPALIQMVTSSITGDFSAETIEKKPRTNVCTYLLEEDGESTVKIIRNHEEKQDEKENSAH